MSEHPPLRIYSPEEVDLFLSGDRREVDRLLLQGLNGLSHVMIEHTRKEEEIFTGMGDTETIRARRKWVDAQMAKQEKLNAMMDKVATSAVSWALIAFLGFLAYAIWDYTVEHARTAMAASAGKR
jgi:hypothetical protein